MSMTLESAIIHAEEVADRCAVTDGNRQCEDEHRQLAAWLRELQERRAEPEITTGEWELKNHQWECDKCGCRINVKNPLDCDKWNYYYCPHCGTKMLIAVQRGR